jgi:hypothetical protein
VLVRVGSWLIFCAFSCPCWSVLVRGHFPWFFLFVLVRAGSWLIFFKCL